jgi:endo-1,4-beta-xylanase
MMLKKVLTFAPLALLLSAQSADRGSLKDIFADSFHIGVAVNAWQVNGRKSLFPYSKSLQQP